MNIERRAFLRGGLASLALISNRNLLRGLNDKGGQFYASGPLYSFDLLKWLYVGWENDHPKSWTFMGASNRNPAFGGAGSRAPLEVC